MAWMRAALRLHLMTLSRALHARGRSRPTAACTTEAARATGALLHDAYAKRRRWIGKRSSAPYRRANFCYFPPVAQSTRLLRIATAIP